MSSFKLIASVQVNEAISADKYRDEETGLTLVFVDIEGPLVFGFFVLPTEANDDDGLPHILEHLIFQGSEEYPVKGVLNLLGNRCLSPGTNAWTQVDHTCYTIMTVGSDGFLTLMPIYLDHILYPSLSDSAFMTEAHHISDKGKDGGTVYSEMQKLANTKWRKTTLKLRKTLYPFAGYGFEVGGDLKNLRTSSTIEKVRAYHKKFYRPENLTLIITGKVDPELVFTTLEPVQEKIKSKPQDERFVKPWRTPIQKINQSQDIKIVYPSVNEDYGLVEIAYMEPNLVKEYKTLLILRILLSYMTHTSVSPLQRDMIEIDDPFASGITTYVYEYFEPALSLRFTDVPIHKMDVILNKFRETLNKISKGEEQIDMQMMKSTIEHSFLQHLRDLENSPNQTLVDLLIVDSIYGGNEGYLKDLFKFKESHEYFLSITEEQWLNLLNVYFVNASFVCIRAFPSIEEKQRLAEEESSRIENQKEQLSEKGLEEKGELLREAIARNEAEPPSSVMLEVPLSNMDDIKYHYLKVYKSNEVNNVENVFNFSDIPIYAEVHDVHTSFTTITVAMNTECLSQSLRPYLHLFMDLLLQAHVIHNGQLIPYEVVALRLQRNTLSTRSGIGLNSYSKVSCGQYSHLAMIHMQVEPRKYQSTVNVLLKILHCSLFTVDRVRAVATKLQNKITTAQSDASFMVAEITRILLYREESNDKILSLINHQQFLTQLVKRLDDSYQASRILDDLNCIRRSLTKVENLSVFIATDVLKRTKESVNLSKVWRKISSPRKGLVKHDLCSTPDWKQINYEKSGLEDGFNGAIIGMSTVESSFSLHSVEAIKDYLSPDLPALLLYLEYFSQFEGPFWKQVRGQGLASDCRIIANLNEGMIQLMLNEASNLIAAFKEIKAIIQDPSWDEHLLLSARGSAIFKTIVIEGDIGDIPRQALSFSYKKLPLDYNRLLVGKIREVTEDELTAVGKKYISRLFSPAANTSIVCQPDKVEEIIEAFDGMNIKLAKLSSLMEIS